MSEAGAGKPRGRRVLKVAALCMLALAASYGTWYGYIYNQALQPQTGPLTEADQRVIRFHGCNVVTGGDIYVLRSTALRYLRVMVKGDSNSIRFYQQGRAAAKKDGIDWYQEDMVETMFFASRDYNKAAYSLILQALETKDDYPMVLNAAAGRVGMYAMRRMDIVRQYGDDRPLKCLYKMLRSNKDYHRLSAASALNNFGYHDVALNTREDIIKNGSQYACQAVQTLYDYRTEKVDDEKSLAILIRTLTYQTTSEAKSEAVYFLTKSGHAAIAEPVAIELLKKACGITDTANAVGPCDGRARDNVVHALIRMNSKAAIPYLKLLVINGKASYNASSILEYLRATDFMAYLEAKEYDDTHH
ncbi:MAG: hypothetical protein HZC51_06940 [Nitrospirae bacterium]|nr:hypothetical protein [Nitrospirota bacterium]